MSNKKEKRGRKALPPEQKKPPQPTIKINDFLYPFVKLLKREHKAKRVDINKLNALTQLLLEDVDPINNLSEIQQVTENNQSEAITPAKKRTTATSKKQKSKKS